MLHFLTNDIKEISVNTCVQDVAKLVDICSSKRPLTKVIISTGLPRGDSNVLNDKIHVCNVKLLGMYVESENVSFYNNSSLAMRGNPNITSFSFERVHLSGNGIRMFATDLKVFCLLECVVMWLISMPVIKV